MLNHIGLIECHFGCHTNYSYIHDLTGDTRSYNFALASSFLHLRSAWHESVSRYPQLEWRTFLLRSPIVWQHLSTVGEVYAQKECMNECDDLRRILPFFPYIIRFLWIRCECIFAPLFEKVFVAGAESTIVTSSSQDSADESRIAFPFWGAILLITR